jgi:transcription initiation factor TFIIE subunit beta
MSSTKYPAEEPARREYVGTDVVYAVNRLREKFPESQTQEELVTYVLNKQRRDDSAYVQLFISQLLINPKVNYDKEKDEFIFKPEHNITDADSLLKYLQNQDTAMGIQVSKLKDGWQGVESTIDKLEADHRLLVTRNRKDNHPRMVWIDDPTLQAPLDQEFKDLWNQIPLPNVEDTIKELRKMNHKSTGEPAVQETAVKKPKEKKKSRRGTKITNTHMQGIFRDYSDKGKEVKKEVKIEGR